MRSWHVGERALATALIAYAIGLAVVPTAAADPNDAVQAETPAPGPAAGDAPISGDVNPAAAEACSQFAVALDVAAVNYSDFADAISGEDWSYADQNVASTNVTGRTALRQAAAAARTAAATPGLQSEVAAPMRGWSLGATKLLLIMGLHGSGDRVDAAATGLNNHTSNVQLACAAAGTTA